MIENQASDMFKVELHPVQGGGAAAKRLSLHQGLFLWLITSSTSVFWPIGMFGMTPPSVGQVSHGGRESSHRRVLRRPCSICRHDVYMNHDHHHHDHTSHVSPTSKLYLRMFCGSRYKTLWSPLNTFLHWPPKLTVLITPALRLPVSMSYLQTLYTKFIEAPHTNRRYMLYRRYRVSLLMLTLFPPSQSWGAFYRGHMRALCHRGCSLFHPGHPHSPGLRYRPETG